MCFGLGVVEVFIYFVGGKFNVIWMMQNECGCGVMLFDGGVLLGVVLGVLIIVGLIVEFNLWCMLFVVVGIGMMVVGLFVWWYICNYLCEYLFVNDVEVFYIEEVYVVDQVVELVVVSGNVFDFFKYCLVWGMFFGWMCFNVLFYGLLIWMLIYLLKVYGLDIKEMGGVVFIMFFFGFVGEMVGGWIVDKWMVIGVL